MKLVGESIANLSGGAEWRCRREGDAQFPGSIAQLSASLADVKMADLRDEKVSSCTLEAIFEVQSGVEGSRRDPTRRGCHGDNKQQHVDSPRHACLQKELKASRR